MSNGDHLQLQPITTAVIPVAGYGTRRLPITKAIEKCMLPIGDRPLVDYVVADCAAAGVQRIVFVVLEQSEQLRRYYGRNLQLEEYLETRGRHKELEVMNSTGCGMDIEFIVQPPNGSYGTAVPLQCAKPALAGVDRFALLMGDDFVWRPDGSSELHDLVQNWLLEARHMMMAAPVKAEDASRYGLLSVSDGGLLEGIMEKPTANQISGRNLINISKYVFSESILSHVDAYMAQSRAASEEFYITDVIANAIALGEAVGVHRIAGEYLDGGTYEGWLQANINVVASGPH